MKKLVSFLMIMVLAVSMMVPFPITVAAETATSGTTGDCTWTLNGTILTISGEGAMEDYTGSSREYPWGSFYALNSNAPWGYGVTEVIFEEGVTSIGSFALACNESLTSIKISETVTTIGDFAFDSCWSLEEIVIPDSVLTIGDNAFSGRKCADITIGTGVKSIGDYAFATSSDSTNLYITDLTAWCNVNFSYYTSSPFFWSGDGVKPKFVANLYLNNKLITKLGIPRGITEIKGAAFYQCTTLTSVTIPDSVTSIGWSAFSECDSLTSVTIGNGVTSIGGSAFENCDNLTSITIPDNVTSIGYCAFYKCFSLKSVIIPDGVTSLGNSAFYECINLTSVTIGNGITGIGNFAFYNCDSLTLVTIGNSVTSIGDYAFYECGSLTSIAIPHTVTAIGVNAFDTWTYSDYTDATLMVHEDSAGHTYALKYGNPYELTNHTYGESTVNPSTCTQAGSETKACTVCEKEITVELPMADHTPAGEPIIISPTCTTAGFETNYCTVCESDYTVTLPPLEHIFENNICTLCGCPDIQSEHPYGNNLDQTWVHTIEGATSISVTFSEETYVEEYIDYITLYDGEDNEINYYTGTELAGQTVTIPGDTVKIRLESDDSGNGYGFSVTAITAELPESPEIPTYNGIELSTAGAIQLLRYIDHREGLTVEQADINGDGKVTVFDAVRFLQILNTTPIA